MWRYLLALGGALYLGMWFVGRDHGQQRWGLRDAPVAVTKPAVPSEPLVQEVAVIPPATPLVPVPETPTGPVVQPVATASPFSAEAQSAAATEVEPEPEVFTLADPNVATSALSQKTVTAPAAHQAAAAMSQDPFPSSETSAAEPAAAPVVAAPEALADQVAAPAPLPANARTILGRAVNLRKGPSNDELAVTTLFRGDVVEVLAKTLNGWVRVRSLADGSEGYVSSRFISSQPAN